MRLFIKDERTELYAAGLFVLSLALLTVVVVWLSAHFF